MAPISASPTQRPELECPKGLTLQPAEEIPPQSDSREQGSSDPGSSPRLFKLSQVPFHPGHEGLIPKILPALASEGPAIACPRERLVRTYLASWPSSRLR